MSTSTAKFIIERNVGEKIGEFFDVKDLINTGRYYIAKIVRFIFPKASIIKRRIQSILTAPNGKTVIGDI